LSFYSKPGVTQLTIKTSQPSLAPTESICTLSLKEADAFCFKQENFNSLLVYPNYVDYDVPRHNEASSLY
jgi:hypothetical protein